MKVIFVSVHENHYAGKMKHSVKIINRMGTVYRKYKFKKITGTLISYMRTRGFLTYNSKCIYNHMSSTTIGTITTAH